ncbi:MAG TPA: hypothetical protein VJ891_02710, partial [Casimicrobiaceae bacterium]|nr:hypothetical protein [Casimicrobiaceae bacterium]
MSHRGMFVLAAILACNLRMALGEPITPPPIASEAPREAAIPAAGSFPPAATVLARFPVAFEVNEGQYDPAVRYLARASGYRVVLSDAGATFCLPSATRDQDSPGPGVVQLRFVNGNRAPVVRPSQPLHRTNYFIGENPAQFHTDIENFAQVLYTEIYANVDV